jgi:hypothetical protein
MAVSNTTVIYCNISTLEITGIFITLAANYHGIFTPVNYRAIFTTLASGLG